MGIWSLLGFLSHRLGASQVPSTPQVGALACSNNHQEVGDDLAVLYCSFDVSWIVAYQ